MGSIIQSVGTSKGNRVLTNLDLEKILAFSGQSTSDEWIVGRTGITRRFVSPDLGVEDLATQASINALDYSKQKVTPIEYVIVATNTPQSPFPNVAGHLAYEISKARPDMIKPKVGGSDLYGGCGGINLALRQADALIKSKEFESVLVVGAEKLSDVTDYSDRKTAILFGDGASAYILGKGNDNEGFIRHYSQGDGENRDLINCTRRNKVDLLNAISILDQGISPVKSEGRILEMDGPRVFRYVVEQWGKLLGNISELFDEKVSYESISNIAPHLANLRCLEAVAKEYPGFLDKCGLVTNEDLADFHNTSTASQGRRVRQFLDKAQVGEYLLMFGYGAGLQSCANLYRKPAA